jgi:hypothetical protein
MPGPASGLLVVVQLSSERRLSAKRLTLLLPSRRSCLDLRARCSSRGVICSSTSETPAAAAKALVGSARPPAGLLLLQEPWGRRSSARRGQVGVELETRPSDYESESAATLAAAGDRRGDVRASCGGRCREGRDYRPRGRIMNHIITPIISMQATNGRNAAAATSLPHFERTGDLGGDRSRRRHAVLRYPRRWHPPVLRDPRRSPDTGPRGGRGARVATADCRRTSCGGRRFGDLASHPGLGFCQTGLEVLGAQAVDVRHGLPDRVDQRRIHGVGRRQSRRSR